MPVMAWITTVSNWQFAIAPGLIGGIICGALFFLLGKDWPSQLSLPAYGDDKIYYPPEENTGNAVSISFKALSGAIKHPAFWILAITFFICGLTSTGIVGQHFIPFCADNNVGIIMASSYLALMGFFNFVGTMGSGWLSDRYNNYTLLGLYYGLRGLSLLYLPYSNFDVYSLTLWAIFFGLDFIATVPPTVKLSGQFFGMINGPIVFGWIFGAHQLGSAVAAYGSGLSRDILSTYVPAFFLAGFACFIATVLFVYLLTFKPKFSINAPSEAL
jgi:predicted MFS family arabinose efflux permease